METGGEMNPAKRGMNGAGRAMNVNIRVIRAIRGKRICSCFVAKFRYCR